MSNDSSSKVKKGVLAALFVLACAGALGAGALSWQRTNRIKNGPADFAITVQDLAIRKFQKAKNVPAWDPARPFVDSVVEVTGLMKRGPGPSFVLESGQQVQLEGGALVSMDIYASTSVAPEVWPADGHRVTIRGLGSRDGKGALFVADAVFVRAEPASPR